MGLERSAATLSPVFRMLKLMNGMVVDKLKDPGRHFSKRELLYPIVPVATV
jgi:hypothetical protein